MSRPRTVDRSRRSVGKPRTGLFKAFRLRKRAAWCCCGTATQTIGGGSLSAAVLSGLSRTQIEVIWPLTASPVITIGPSGVSRTSEGLALTSMRRTGRFLGVPGGGHRVGKPRSDVHFSPSALCPQTVEGQARGDGCEPAGRVVHGGGVSGGPPYPRFLHHVFGVGQRARDPVGQAGQARTLPLEGVETARCRCRVHATLG